MSLYCPKGWKWIEIVEGPFFVREDLLLKFLTKNRKFKEDGGHGNAGTGSLEAELEVRGFLIRIEADSFSQIHF